MIKIVIIDDSIEVLKDLQNLCSDYFTKKNYLFEVETFSIVNEFLAKDRKYDIVFLDIEMPQIDGLELAKILRKKDKECCICFVSNYNKYALSSFDVHAFDFIEKPITKFQIYKTLDEMFAYYGFKMVNKTKIIFDVNGKEKCVSIHDILYFEYLDSSKDFFNRSTVLYTFTDIIALRTKIGGVYETLPNDMFSVPHKAFIVNFSNISAIQGSVIIMNNGHKIPLSQKRASQFRKDFNLYIKKYFIG